MMLVVGDDFSLWSPYCPSGFLLPFAVCGGAILVTSFLSFPIVRPLTKVMMMPADVAKSVKIYVYDGWIVILKLKHQNNWAHWRRRRVRFLQSCLLLDLFSLPSSLSPPSWYKHYFHWVSMIIISNTIIRNQTLLCYGQVTCGAAITFGFIESLLELYLETFELRLTSESESPWSWPPIRASLLLSPWPLPSPPTLCLLEYWLWPF